LIEKYFLGSQGGAVSCSLDFRPGGPGLTPTRGNQQKNIKIYNKNPTKYALKND